MRRCAGIRSPRCSSPATTRVPRCATCASEVHAYLAATLLGGPRAVTGDLGVATITDQRRLELRAVERLGDDVLVIAGVPWAVSLNEAAAEYTSAASADRVFAESSLSLHTQGA
jgi:hypothetical protein